MLVSKLKIPAKRLAESTVSQWTFVKMASVPMVATAVWARVRTARIPAARHQMLQFRFSMLCSFLQLFQVIDPMIGDLELFQHQTALLLQLIGSIN